MPLQGNNKMTSAPPAFNPVIPPGVSLAVSSPADRPNVLGGKPTVQPMPFMTPTQVSADRAALAATLNEPAPATDAPPEAPPAVAAPPAPAAPQAQPPVSQDAPPTSIVAAKAAEPESPQQMTWRKVNEAEARVREKMSALRAEQEAFNKAKQEFEHGRNKAGDVDSRELAMQLAASPIKTLASMGLNIEDVLRSAIAEKNGQAPQGPHIPQRSQADSGVAELKQEIAGLRQYIEETQRQGEARQRLAAFRSDLSRELTKPENGLLTAFPGVEDTMIANAARYAELTDGQVLTTDRVAAMMRSELEEHVAALFDHPAVQQFLAARKQKVAPSPAPHVAQQQQPQRVTPKFQPAQGASQPAVQDDNRVMTLEDLAAEVTEATWGS